MIQGGRGGIVRCASSSLSADVIGVGSGFTSLHLHALAYCCTRLRVVARGLGVVHWVREVWDKAESGEEAANGMMQKT